MESWRERGFVPDSDSEVEFDSQESKVVNWRVEDGDGGIEEVVAPNAKHTAPAAAHDEANEGGSDGAGDNGTEKAQNVVLGSKDNEESTPNIDKAEEDATMVDVRKKTSQDGSSSVQGSQKDPAGQSMPSAREVAESSSSSSGVTATNPSTPSTPRTQPQAGIWDIPSSPDELQFDLQPSRRRITYFSKKKDPETQNNSSTINDAETQLVNENVNISPLSSPLSSLHSIPLGEDDDSLRDRQEGQKETEATETQAPQNREEPLLPFEIPDHILQEMSQPMRRSLRQRNPIQLHPYLLEDAKYRSLMKARGLKPVRVPHNQAVHDTADESQSKDFEPPSSSPVEDFQFPPSSPATDPPLPDRYVHEDSLHRRGRLDPEGHLANRPDARPSKRRRVSRPEDAERLSLKHAPQPKVVICRSPARPENNSIFNIPSPPRSGSISSTQTSQHAEGFRFPLGFTPPTLTTPVTETRVNGRNAINSDMTDWLAGADDQVSVDGEATNQSQPNTDVDEDAPEEDDELAAARALQRKIRGVLPASWLRLDQKNQRQENLPSTQRQRERFASHRTENAKGVARKITKKNDSRMDSTAREPLASLSHLADDDSGESTGPEEDMPAVDAHKKLAELFNLDLPFDDDIAGDDIPESDHIDYMLPPIPRGPTGPRSRKPDKKRQRTEIGGSHSHNRNKRPRLKRQTRITDPEYGARKEREGTRRLPRLGILDAPDVAHQPREEQPQFLRVAARRARSRKDMGRRSPSRKFIKLGSRLDTEDANKALGEWRKGKLRQTQLPQVQTKLYARPPLLDRPVNQSAVIANHNPHSKERGFLPDPKRTAQVDLTDDAPDETRPDVPAIAPTTERDISPRPKPASGQQGRKWVIHRNFAVSSLKRNGPRPAEPEITDASRNSASPSLFQKTLAQLNRDYRHKHPTHRSLPLDRYLANNPTPSLPTRVQPDEIPNAATDASPTPPGHTRRRKLKKRPPRRLDLAALDGQEVDTRDSVTIMPADGVILETSRSTVSTGNGLKSFRRTYTVDFDVTPLCPGTFFHESTFIGSGQFSRSLKVESRNMDVKSGLSRIKFRDQCFRWGPWNDTVSSELGQVFDVMIEEMETNAASEISTGIDQETASHDVCALYRSLVQYVTEHLAFEDPIDRMGFVKRSQSLITKLNEQLAAMVLSDERQRDYLTRFASYNLVFASQAFQVACHALVDGKTAHEISDMVKIAARRVLGFIASRTAQIQMRAFLQDNKSPTKREAGIQADQSVIEAYVIMRHVLQSMDELKGCFGELIAEAYLSAGGDTSNSRDIDGFENGWQSLFTTLPLNEFDSCGLVRIGARFREAHDNWLMVKRLLSPVLDNYDINAETQPISCNNYCRAVFRRCYHLINGWGWRDCRPIMQLLYDFFAKRHLYDLKLEESYKSPSFLDGLDRNPSFDVQPGDPSYHIFLKILATGLRFLPLSCDKKQIRNFAWRLLPNHDGRYPKEKPISQSDLDAVRNHHDLLCTLYFAVPDGCRPRLEIIKTLVDPAISHRETCNISIRAWSRLVRFKLSTDEDLSGLEPFADWHCFFLNEFLKQHSLARKEIEAQNAIENSFSHDEVEKTISQNQRQIESLLTMALGGLQSAVRSAPTLDHARVVVSKAPIRAILGLFNPRVAHVNAVVSEALRVIIAYLQKCDANPVPAAKAPTVPVDEDSQEYGDWTDIEAIYGGETPPPSKGIEHVESVFLPAVSRLVSNCFGEDHCPEDAILLNVVDCWTSIASVLVKHGLKHWDNYLGHYDGESWSSLRSTVQTRKFTPLFLASCIERDPQCLSECRLLILSMWLSSLVERVSMLKFQHRLTEALLNLDTTDPLLHNLPFSKDRQNHRYSISLEDLSQRRLSLLSSLLSNMRAHVQDLEDTENRELSSTRRDYRELIQRMMASMKANYQELGNGGASAQGAYVDFVHRIVGFLQQYSRDICPIDSFFTDPTSFPLPSADPTYIVARLKSYEPKLCSEKVVKTLTVFVQGVSERAAIDGQQVYLVDQLHTSMADIYETGDPYKPTLRAILLQCVFPAYIECAFTNPAAWLLSRPIIQTVSLVFKDLLFFMDITDAMCRHSVLAILGAVFRSSYRAFRYITATPRMLTDSTVMATLTSLVEMITSAIPVVDYIDRATDVRVCAVSQIAALHGLVLLVTSSLREEPLASETFDLVQSSKAFDNDATSNPAVPSFFWDLRTAATHELQAYLNDSWSQHQGKYYFTRRGGQQPQEVQLEPSVAAEIEQTPAVAFDEAVQTFLDTVRAVDLFDEAD
ncbi:protein mms22 [Aspergillus udagawae]|uniref:Protein mms22 n=1 Tax=Aspergillus udagawae TaxID=91492 RepID=A0ABQ1AHI1_9EURO|nr:protein mms22 [Aspergillus udagawae]